MPLKHHVFFCTNRRPEGHAVGCCASKGSETLCAQMKRRVKEAGLTEVRVTQAGCLRRCGDGPSVVIYPEGVWYTVRSESDLDTILHQHIGLGETVTSLLMK